MVKFFVMRFDLATSTKPMFEVRMDEFGRLLVNKRSKRIEKISVIGLYMLCECGNLKKRKLYKNPQQRQKSNVQVGDFYLSISPAGAKVQPNLLPYTAVAAYFFFSTTLLNTRIATTTAIPITSVRSAG